MDAAASMLHELAIDDDKPKKRMRLQQPQRKQKQPQPYQQYMVPFLFQQSVSKKFDNMNLFYYDEEWSPVRQGRSGRHASFQDQFPNLQQVEKNSTSQSIVYRGTHKGRRVFVKSFVCGRSPAEFNALRDSVKALSYEKEVYRYIRHVSETDDEVRRHFIQMLFCAKDDVNGVAYIFSQDAGGKSLHEYLTQGRLSFAFLVGVMTQYLYLLHLLHDKLRITHNDLHDGNLIVVRDNQPQKTYTFCGRTFRLTDHPYTLMVYDFDMASVCQPPAWQNPFLTFMCHKYGRCPDYPATDFYIYLSILIDHSAPAQYKGGTDEVEHNLLITAYQDIMPDNLFEHVERVSEHFHYAACEDTTWDGKCVLPRSPPTLPQLTRYWHQALRTKPEDMGVVDALPVLLDLKKYFGRFIFIVRKHSKCHITTRPSTSDIMTANRVIAVSGVGPLIPPGLDKEDADGVRELFLEQYKNTKHFQQHLRKKQQQKTRGGTTGT